MPITKRCSSANSTYHCAQSTMPPVDRRAAGQMP